MAKKPVNIMALMIPSMRLLTKSIKEFSLKGCVYLNIISNRNVNVVSRCKIEVEEFWDIVKIHQTYYEQNVLVVERKG